MATDAQADNVVNVLERELRDLLRRAPSSATHLARRIHPGLEASAYPLLAQIGAQPGVHGSQLAQHFGVGRATISRQLARLRELGLVTRATDPEDSRGQLISLTDDGRARLDAAHGARVTTIAAALEDWDPEEISTLAALLHRYSTDVGQWIDNH